MVFDGLKGLFGGSASGRSLDLSVIVTFRDCADHLRECLDSLEAQTFGGSWEVLLVADGSADESVALAREYADRLPHFRLLQQSAQGMGAARNLGLQQARGAYVAFVNGTDAVCPQAYEFMMAAAKREQADLVLCHAARYLGPENLTISYLHQLAYRNVPAVTTFEESPYLLYDLMPFGKLISWRLCQEAKLSFAAGKGYVDLLPVLRLLNLAGKICLHPGVEYLWRSEIPSCGAAECSFELDDFEHRMACLQQCYDYACQQGFEPGQFKALDVRVLEHDLMGAINCLPHLQPEAAKQRMARMSDLLSKWTLFDELALLSVTTRQRYAHVQAGNLDGLLEFMEWEREYAPTARVGLTKTGRYFINVPEGLRSVERTGITQSIMRWPAICKLTDADAEGEKLHLHGFAYKRRTTVPEGAQTVKAFLVNARTGKQVSLPALPEANANAKRCYGVILEKQTGQNRRYETAGAGFCLTVDLGEVAKDPAMHGVNYVRVHYVNPQERGFGHMGTIRQAIRPQLQELVCAVEGVQARIDLGPLDQVRLVVEPSGPAGQADPA